MAMIALFGTGVGVVTVLASVSVGVSLKCRTSVDAGLKWTVDCSAMNLSREPPPLNLHPVHSLLLKYNQFVRLKESQFSNWTGISHLDLSFNNIKTIDEGTFKGLSGLSELNLMYNDIEILSSNITKYLPNLKILYLSSNKLTVITQEAFYCTPLLLKLYIENNFYLGKISPVSYNTLSKLSSLVSLDISNTSLAKLPDDFFSNSTRLITLNLSNNPIINIPNIFCCLRSLNISGTLLQSINPTFLSKSDALRKLSIENMPLLKDIQPSALIGLKSLEELYINDCLKLGFISSNLFGETQPKLKRVSISNCALTTLSESILPLLAHAQDLNLQGNPWMCDGQIAWMSNLSLRPNYTLQLRCDKPLTARGMLLTDYFKPRRPHSWTSLVRAGVIIAMVAILVASLVGMIRQLKREEHKTYYQLQNLDLQRRRSLQQPVA